MSTKNPKKEAKQKVNKIITHLDPHADEFLAIYFLRRYGQKVFPGITEAKISTKDGGVQLVNRKDWLKIGIGEGQFDEHGPGKKDYCCADLVAQHLGIDQMPKVKLLLKQIRRGDLFGKSTTLDLGQCVRILNHDGWTPAKIEKWLSVLLDCYFDDKTIIKGFSHEDCMDKIIFPVSDQETRKIISENTFYHNWLKSKKLCDNDPEVRELTRNLKQFSSQLPSKIFDICEGVNLIAAHLGKLEASAWASSIFEAKKNFQTEFLKASEIIKTKQVISIKPFDGCKQSDYIHILGIDRRGNQAGNKCLLAATRFLKKNLDILVIQQPTGCVQIFILHQHRHILWPIIVRSIRLEEMIVNNIPIEEIFTDFDKLVETGNLPEIPQWYFPANGDGVGWALLNGSITMPNISPTNIFFDEIIKIISQVVIIQNNNQNWKKYANQRLRKYRQSFYQPSNGNCLGDIATFSSLK